MISYAQNREDVLINRLFKGKKEGFYIDVGAAHPVKDSVTKWFYDQGWSGINVEPVQEYFAMIQEQRPRDINLNVAVSEKEGTAKLYSIPPYFGLSSLSSEQVDHAQVEGTEKRREIEVPVLTLAGICRQYVKGTVDFLKVDVEGFERNVIAGADFKTFRPRLIVVEATLPQSSEPSHESWEPLLLASDYLFAYFDGLNRYYLRSEDAALLKSFHAPANVFDDFKAWDLVETEQKLHQMWLDFVAAQSEVKQLKSAIHRCDDFLKDIGAT